MKRQIKNPRMLLHWPLEYKKEESQTNMEFSKGSDWARAQDIEDEQVKALVNKILEFKPVILQRRACLVRLLINFVLFLSDSTTLDLDTAQYVLERHNVSALRRVRKSDNNCIALAVGGTIVNRVEDLHESDIGTKCSLFNIEKIVDE